MGEAKRRKQLDPNYGKPKKMKEICDKNNVPTFRVGNRLFAYSPRRRGMGTKASDYTKPDFDHDSFDIDIPHTCLDWQYYFFDPNTWRPEEEEELMALVDSWADVNPINAVNGHQGALFQFLVRKYQRGKLLLQGEGVFELTH